MGLTYHYTFVAPSDVTAAELKAFLKTVETEAVDLGFEPTLVLSARFDTPERQEFARRLTTGHVITIEQPAGAAQLIDGQVWGHNAKTGECRVIPKEAVVLVVTDEDGKEGAFGFFRYPAYLEDVNGRKIPTDVGEDWVFSDHVKSSDSRIRQIVKKFAEAGFVKSKLDEFASPARAI